MIFQEHEHTVNVQKCVWQILILGLQQLDPASAEAKEILKSGILGVPPRSEPDIKIADNQVFCGGIKLDLSGAEMTYKVFAAFAAEPKHRLSRANLVTSVYGISNFESLSVRRQESLKHSVVKLVSRARRAARTAFASEENRFVEWFPYDTNSGQWRLLRVADPSDTADGGLQYNSLG